MEVDCSGKGKGKGKKHWQWQGSKDRQTRQRVATCAERNVTSHETAGDGIHQGTTVDEVEGAEKRVPTQHNSLC